jgi:RNA polymerase primary sigma factor
MNDIDRYLQELLTQDIPQLTIKQEHDLAKRIAKGDDNALDKLIKHNLRFVVYVLSKTSAWQHSKVPQQDIVAMGNEALFMAGRSWKPTNNARFATYAKPFIERGVRRELNNTANLIRLPVNIMQDIKRLSVAEKGLTQVLNRKPKIAEIAKIMEVPESKIHQLRGFIKREPLSLDSVNQQKNIDEAQDD